MATGTSAPVAERLRRSIKVVGGCWIWQLYIEPGGYGQIRVGDRPLRAHRVAYETFVGPIPEGMHIDHLCRNRGCINPEHLEPVTARENSERGLHGVLTTHCPKGHPYDWNNTYKHPDGRRICRACRRQYMRERRRSA